MRRFASFAAAAVLTLGLGLMAVADEVKKPEAPPPAKPNPNAQVINRLLAANELIEFRARQEIAHRADRRRPAAARHADAAAARHGQGRRQGPGRTRQANGQGRQGHAGVLLAEAKKMSSDDTHVVALISELEKQFKESPRNLADGPFSGQFFMDPGEKALYPPVFRGGEWAEVTCRVIGPGQVTLKASDPKEGVDESDFGQVCHVKWFQCADGRVNIIRKNESGQPIKVYFYVP